MRSLTIVERYGQWTVTSSDGHGGKGATLYSALGKAFGSLGDEQRLTLLLDIFDAIQEAPDGGQIHEGPVGA